ncbi:MAG: selenium cofactor biosynthesis protein YqeC, partial [Chloroflexota bacterium]
ASARLKVITTTTTKIGAPSAEQTSAFIVSDDRAQLLAQAEQALMAHRHVTVACAPYGPDKYRGVPAEWIAALRALPGVYAVIVEADGARKLPFKAPRADEPIIPPETTLLVVCAGMTAVGTPLDEQHVCRADIAAALADAQLGDVLTAEQIARVMAHPDGGLKHHPTHARGVALLNQADTPTRWDAAHNIADVLHHTNAFDEVLIGALANEDPILERRGRVSAIIMAAGEGRRFGGSIKQLAPWGERTLIQHIIGLAEQSCADEIQVVLGAHADQIRARLNHLDARTRITLNDQWRDGMSTSVKAGLAQTQTHPNAAVFVNVDQPGIHPGLIDRLIHRHRTTGAPIVAPRYQNLRGNPVLWDRSLFAELQTLNGDVGGREILRQHWREIAWVELDSEEELTDTDTPEEYQRLKEILNA